MLRIYKYESEIYMYTIPARAINSSPEKKLKLCQIYEWIKANFPYYKVWVIYEFSMF